MVSVPSGCTSNKLVLTVYEFSEERRETQGSVCGFPMTPSHPHMLLRATYGTQSPALSQLIIARSLDFFKSSYRFGRFTSSCHLSTFSINSTSFIEKHFSMLEQKSSSFATRVSSRAADKRCAQCQCEVNGPQPASPPRVSSRHKPARFLVAARHQVFAYVGDVAWGSDSNPPSAGIDSHPTLDRGMAEFLLVVVGGGVRRGGAESESALLVSIVSLQQQSALLPLPHPPHPIVPRRSIGPRHRSLPSPKLWSPKFYFILNVP
ncbi:hypothetical protein J6590_047809 [Homalodisca vitripennis]|nr:hypothetical protein J6590_047809 [Homalodisca vitripennis]